MILKNLIRVGVLALVVPALGFSHGTSKENKYQFNKKDKSVFITVDSDSIKSSRKSFGKAIDSVVTADGLSILEIKEGALPYLSEMMHSEFNRCAGYMFHDTLEGAQKELNGSMKRSLATKAIFADYSINQQDIIPPLINQVSAINIAGTINKLSSYKNRYYTSKSGIESSKWIANKWKELTAARSDAKVELYKHSWAQSTVILTIKGQSNEVIVIGGHADSVAGWMGRANARAPGADDNASGIATITEIIRVIVQNNYVPKKTLKFMGYAAEEVGLRGSKAVAKDFKKTGVNVIGVMQLDMTNFNGSKLDIVMMTDFTNAEQNTFIGKILDEYLPEVSWGYDKCGYACSDHASWTGQGFPASMPFEAKVKEMNRNIHTSRDTISRSGDNALHASKFAKMGIAYLVELDK